MKIRLNGLLPGTLFLRALQVIARDSFFRAAEIRVNVGKKFPSSSLSLEREAVRRLQRRLESMKLVYGTFMGFHPRATVTDT